jgi:hypothetical protein
MWAISHVCSHFSIAIWLRYESAQARIAALTGFDKEEIEGCLREVVLALAERLDAPEGISLEFVGIGRLSLRRRKLRFKFYSEFEESPQVRVVLCVHARAYIYVCARTRLSVLFGG